MPVKPTTTKPVSGPPPADNVLNTLTTASASGGFEEKIQRWVHLDNQLKDLGDKVRNLRNERNAVNDDILEFVDANNLNTATIKLGDGKLKFGEVKQTAPLTLTFLEKCLGELITNQTQVDQIMNYIKQKREVKSVPEIKRYYNKTDTTVPDDEE